MAAPGHRLASAREALPADLDGEDDVGLVSLAHRSRLLFARSGLRRQLEQLSGLVLVGLGARLAMERRWGHSWRLGSTGH